MMSTLSTFRANRLSLRRGARVIWDDATWSISGPTAVVGSNGTGKSSTLALLAGQLAPDGGSLEYHHGNRLVLPEAWLTQVTLAAPWVELPSQLTLGEAFQFHGEFRRPRKGELSWEALTESSGLLVASDIPLGSWSSGQRQRLVLALALGTETSAVLLDEPTANLDHEGLAWYRRVVDAVCGECTVVVATNDEKKEAPKSASLLRI